ncbi:uncharacterized protein LOC123699803 [Colias croceus]|uniref:uncharacterized protein LOC123699803 n=1 Tax=Colias crocea TaxID=72248 RepID=UPI001E27A1A1|nr:uncharacterized protein LOC123699803 [Colias croceus]
MIIALQTLIFFREALVRVLDSFLRPYYKNFRLTFNSNEDLSDDEDSEEQVFAEYHDEKGVVFFPPVYVQRYAAVSDCLMDEKWSGKLEKVVDFGYHDMSFIKYLKEVPGIKHILGVDIETIPLQCSSDLFRCEDYIPKRENPLKVTLFQGNAADPDYRLIGCDAVVAIEMIEHMLPHDLERFIHTVFGFIKPWVVIFTTPNGDFNVLFKSLEKNGLRRLDHFFEWSREQFNDWCSNIVVRYPQYTVSCKGIGPGPPDTLHLGCCSQMAVFVAKDYEKQRDLNINSLALVASQDVPNNSNFEDMSSSYECIPDNNMLFLTNDYYILPRPETYSENPSIKQSCVTIILSSPMYSYHSIDYQDKTFQCNLETEWGKDFLFEQESCNIVEPRRKKLYRIYEFEDVNNRLNCSTLQVKKFSKTTQNLMAKNKGDALVHTREVVDEIRHLTKMLNFNKGSCTQYGGDHIWYNINWGDNAPYWNQYYKVVRDYSYPFETKSDDCRILDLISEEINRLIDNQWEEDLTADVNKLEIPIQQLMHVVQHITQDVEKVKELLEWNGYQIVDDVVIHSRLVVDTTSVVTQEDDWLDNDTISDWDTSDLRSTSLSDGSTNVPEFYGSIIPLGRCLRRALDQKVRKLRKLLSADEDITSELDRVVCRLMKLALHTSRTRQTPVPASWMQCKLYDLLALTEKAIERRKKHYLEEYTMRAIEYDKGDNDSQGKLALCNIEEDNRRTDKIMHEYQDLVQPLDEETYNLQSESYLKLQVEDENENDFYHGDTKETSLDRVRHEEIYPRCESFTQKTKLEIVREWVDDEYGSFPYNADKKQQEHTDVPSSNYKNKDNKSELSSRSSSASHKSMKSKSKHLIIPKSEIKITKKVSKKKLNFSILLKNYFIKSGLLDTKPKKKTKGQKKLQSSVAPIPDSLIELCQTNAADQNKAKEINHNMDRIKSIEYSLSVCDVQDDKFENVAATQNSCIISIVTHDAEEQVALKRSIATEPDLNIVDQEAIVEQVISITKEDSLNFSKVNDNEDEQSQTIFLTDINEPSTSKGIRHTRLDVQCGPDDIQDSSELSASTSFTKFPKLFSKGIKIERSHTNLLRKTTFETGTSPDCPACCNEIPKIKSPGIWIHDSDINTELTKHSKPKCSTTSCDTKEIVCSEIIYSEVESKTESTLIKPITSAMKLNCCGSELGCSISTMKIKSPQRLTSPLKNTSSVQIQSCSGKSDLQNSSPTRHVKPKLSCGGICVHSFRDREVSQDVVFQGGWNEIIPKTAPKKTIRKAPLKKGGLTSRQLKRSSSTSVRNTLNNNKINNVNRRPTYMRSVKQKVDKEQPNKTSKTSTMKKPDSSLKNKYNKTNKPIKEMLNLNLDQRYQNISAKSAKYMMERHNISPNPLGKENVFERPSIQNYLPPYLKRKPHKSGSIYDSKNNLSKSIDSAKPLSSIKPALVRSNTEEIKRHAFKENPRMYVSYQVFRNEIENKNYADNIGRVDYNDVGSNSVQRRSSSPISQQSSCSTPNSIATIRAMTSTNKLEASKMSSSNRCGITKSTMTTLGSSLGSKVKNSIIKNINIKRNENKENIPTAKEWKNPNCGIVGSTNSIFKPHTPSIKNSYVHSKPLNISKSKMISKKSTVKLPSIKSTHRLALKTSSSLLLRKSPTDGGSSTEKYSFQSSPSDTVIVLEPYKDELLKGFNEISLELKLENNENEGENINDTTQSTKRDCTESKSIDSNLEESLRKLFDENIELASTPKSNQEYLNSDVIGFLNPDSESNIFNTTSSPASFKTVIENKNSCTFKNELNDALNNSFNRESNSVDEVNSNVTINLTEYSRTVEFTSLESMGSLSKPSEYFLADNQVDLSEDIINKEPSDVSVKGLFERKDLNTATNAVGPIALQAFSGYSMNLVPLAGDQPEYINLVDPETGSLRQEVNRQATSEEILVSGRSSDTYESCYVEDDSFVPSWLFHIISQQQSMDESEEDDEDRLPLQMPIVEPIFDLNGDIGEPGVGAGAGAGDGRGMHSDHSQDSSGRGTSLSSSDTSSDEHSEAILIDPSAYVAQFEFARENADASNVDRPNESPDTSFTTAEADNGFDNRPRPISRTMASDIDADVSSLDTDVADSDA